MTIVFKKFPSGEVIALFPQSTQILGYIDSYMVVGQHSPAHKDLLTDLEDASPSECAEIIHDLQLVGYAI